MSPFDWIALAIGALVLIYLFVVMLFPERLP